jgi:hypothetical protein
MQQEQQQQQGSFQNYKAFFGWFLFICQSLGVSVEIFLHRGMGSRYLGFPALAATVLIFFYPVFWPGCNPEPMQEHSYYTGRPRLMRYMGRASEVTIKRLVEPAFVFFTGIFVMPVSEMLGSYLCLAAGGLLVSVNVNLAYERTQAMDMNDASID